MKRLVSWSRVPSSVGSASTSEQETASFQSSVGKDETQRIEKEPKWRLLVVVVVKETCWESVVVGERGLKE